MLGAALLARNIKKSTYGLEPKEIALLLGQREIVLESLKLGIIAVDKELRVVWINKMAIEEFGFDEDVLLQDVRASYPKLGGAVQEVLTLDQPVITRSCVFIMN